METKEFAANKLVELREKRGLTQREVAEALGISVSAYSAYEIGARTPRDEVKRKIASFYNRSVQFIFFNASTH